MANPYHTTNNPRNIARINVLGKDVNRINKYDADMQAKSQAQLRKQTDYFRASILENVCKSYAPDEDLRSAVQELKSGSQFVHSDRARDLMTELYSYVPDEVMDRKLPAAIKAIMPRAYAVVKETSDRMIDEKHYDAQLLAGIALADGNIVDQKTGEGKTTTTLLFNYLYGLAGRGAHLVTANDILATRDAVKNSKVYNALGLSVGLLKKGDSTGSTESYFIDETGNAQKLVDSMAYDQAQGRVTHTTSVLTQKAAGVAPDVTKVDTSDKTVKRQGRKRAYEADITYSDPHELGFDYIKDDGVQRELVCANLDEIDAILLDEAKVPLSIAEQESTINPHYNTFLPYVNKLIGLQKGHIAKKISEAKDELKKGNIKEAATALLPVKHGDPTNEEYRALVRSNEKLENKLTRMASWEKFTKNSATKDSLLYNVLPNGRGVFLTDRGIEILESKKYGTGIDALFTIPEEEGLDSSEFQAQASAINAIDQLLLASIVFKRATSGDGISEGDDYLVAEDPNNPGKMAIIPISKTDGSPQYGRRYERGLHEALEAKEGIEVGREQSTSESISLMSYFSLYKKAPAGVLAGLTGTAESSKVEFKDSHDLDVFSAPRSYISNRVDKSTMEFKTKERKLESIVRTMSELKEEGVPALVITHSIPESDEITKLLVDKGFVEGEDYHVINALNPKDREKIFALAATRGRETVSTDLGGRGIDYVLGGPKPIRSQYKLDGDFDKDAYDAAHAAWKKDHDEIDELGGLCVMLASRSPHSIRIDEQARGRGGRQDDKGVTMTFVSKEDEIFNYDEPDLVDYIKQKLFGETIDQAATRIQKANEEKASSTRRLMKEYDSVTYFQRSEMHRFRKEIMEDDQAMIEAISRFADDVGLGNEFNGLYQKLTSYTSTILAADADKSPAGVADDIISKLGNHILPALMKHYWAGHLANLRDLRENPAGVAPDVVGELEVPQAGAFDQWLTNQLRCIRTNSNSDPLKHYTIRAFDMFLDMAQDMKYNAVVEVIRQAELSLPREPVPQPTMGSITPPIDQPGRGSWLH